MAAPVSFRERSDSFPLLRGRRPYMTNQACDDVGRAAGGDANNHAHRARRIGLRPRETRHGRESSSARGQMQKISTGKFHLNLPLASHHSITSSARTRNVSGMASPIALAALRLITKSNFMGCSMGSSAGLAPLNILSTYIAARR